MKKTLLLASTALSFIAGSAFAQVNNVTPTDVTQAGINISTSLIANPSPTYFTNDGMTMLLVRTGASGTTATVRTKATQITQQGLGTVQLADQVTVVPANAFMALGPYPIGRFNDPLYNTVRVDFSTAASVMTVHVPQ